jgi:hypothetical protein
MSRSCGRGAYCGRERRPLVAPRSHYTHPGAAVRPSHTLLHSDKAHTRSSDGRPEPKRSCNWSSTCIGSRPSKAGVRWSAPQHTPPSTSSHGVSCLLLGCHKQARSVAAATHRWSSFQHCGAYAHCRLIKLRAERDGRLRIQINDAALGWEHERSIAPRPERPGGAVLYLYNDSATSQPPFPVRARLFGVNPSQQRCHRFGGGLYKPPERGWLN